MKQRVISGIIIGLITTAAVLIGGSFFNVVLVFIAAWGSFEFCNTRNRKLNIFEYLLMLGFICLINLFFDKALGITLALAVLIITLSVFDDTITFDDISVTFIESIILGFGIHYMAEIEYLSKWMFGYIVIIAYLTDVFALLTGMKFGKHKLNERISPKKTVEGALGGWIFGFGISLVYAWILNFFYVDPLFIVICSLVLPVVSQIGDLAFSLIKRHFKIKDFSKLIPGHGGLLDRLDSMFFVLLVYGALAIIVGLY